MTTSISFERWPVVHLPWCTDHDNGRRDCPDHNPAMLFQAPEDATCNHRDDSGIFLSYAPGDGRGPMVFLYEVPLEMTLDEFEAFAAAGLAWALRVRASLADLEVSR